MKTFTLANHHVQPAIALAPMEGITDRFFRRAITQLGGCGMTVTEFVASESLTRNVKQALQMATLDDSTNKNSTNKKEMKTRPLISTQIYGHDLARLTQAAKICEQFGADIIDINLGCPSKRVTKSLAGSALMKDPEHSSKIFHTIKASISIPMTVKMRLGWDRESYNAPEIALRAQDAGASMIAVHARTKADAYRGKAQWTLVRNVVNAVQIPVLVNGDIRSVQTAEQAMQESGAAGIMVGRGILTDPWLLARINAHWNEQPFHEPTIEDRKRALTNYLQTLPQNPPPRIMLKARRIVGYFTKGFYNASKLRQNIQADTSPAKLLHSIELFFQNLTLME